MCGICGFVGPGTRQDLERMTAAVAHRGPDAAGCWMKPELGVFLGHRRLSIVDHATGCQPMSTADGQLVVVFNGEIYNHGELRAELQRLGHHFQSDHSDTEVLLHGFRAWGEELPRRLNGMWAFVLYDLRTRTLFASRDRFGKKPFFYTTIHGGFAFASELESLRAHSLIRPRLTLSSRALKKYFGYGYIPAPLSIWERAYKLPGGHSLHLSLDNPLQPQLKRYWRFELAPEPIDGDAAAREKAEELRATLARAVSRRLVADVPVGVFLSGGIDSSAVTALAAAAVPAGELRTFCVGFEEPSFDESAYARTVAQHCRTQHHEERLSIESGRALLPEIVAKLDEPMGDSSLLPTALLCRYARRHVTVALGGDGGDELFAGYDPFKALRAAERYARWMPRPVHQAIALVASRLPVSHRNMSFDFKLKRFIRGMGTSPALRLPVWMAPLGVGELTDLFGEPVKADDIFSEAVEAWDTCAQANVVDRTLQFYTDLYLQDDILVKVDRASMQVGLEVRAPLLDIDVVDLARRIPWQWKLRGGTTKFLLKKAVEPLLPRDIVHRRKKGFGMPVGAWFKRDLLPIPSPALNPVFTRSRQEAHRTGRSDERAFLWNLWLLSEWKAAHTA